jgi:TonB-dependent SusC/RagA subfamily outer membrane receptor
MTKFYLSFSRYLTVLLMLLTTVAWSQSRTVTGKVISSDDGGALPGVNILEKGTSNGTVTDADGLYSINVGNNATLVLSFVGYASQEISVGTQSSINVTLASDVTALSEVVVVGYGEVNKRDATGSVVSVKAESFNNGLISSPEQLIQGKTAGVQITSSSGAPGAGVQLRIRGTSSIRSNNNPLFVIDGVPLSGGTTSGSADVGFGTNADTNPLNFINPSDIESINILKDASATAIYGSRGANGVVIITTKRGKGSKGTLEFSSNVTVSSARKTYDLLNKDEFLAAVKQYGGDNVAQNYGGDTNWQDYVLRTSYSNKQNLSYSRGFQSGSIRASLGYEDQEGIVKNSFQKRLTGKVNASKSFFANKLTFDLSTTLSNVNREDPAMSGNAGFAGDLLGAAYSANPTWPTDPDFNTGGQRSPANMLKYYKSTGTSNRIVNNISADYKVSNDLTAKATYGIDYSKADRVTLMSGEARNGGDGVQGFGLGQLNNNMSMSNLLELTLNYDKKIGDLNVDVVGGYSVQSFRNKYDWATGRGFDDFKSFSAMESSLRDSYKAGNAAAGALYPHYNNWGAADALQGGAPGDPTTGGFVSGIDFSGDGSLSHKYFAKPAGVTVDGMAANFYDRTDYLQSYFARGNFNLKEKYLLTATFRADGSSKFGTDNKYGFFPSAAAAWKLDQEDFMPEAFSTLKLRVSYGVVGNQDGLGYSEYKRRDRYADTSLGTNRAANVPGTTQIGFANNKLKWESTTQTGVGFDFGILKDKLTGTFDLYNKNTTDLLLKILVAQPASVTQIFQNLNANVINKGWEFSLAYQAIDKQDASFSISGNISHNKNELKNFAGVLDAGQIYGQGLTNAYAQRLAQGYPLFSYHLREFKGFDKNGQPIGDDQKFVGKTALPTWNLGISLNARYKAFDFSMYLAGQFGQYVYNNTRNAFFTAGSINNARNVTHDVITSGESGAAEAAVSTRFLEKGDFLRGQNMMLGYNLPIAGGKFIKKFRVYFNAQNVFVITKYSGPDPEVASNPADYQLLSGLPTAGIDYGAYPRPRTFTFGINAAF